MMTNEAIIYKNRAARLTSDIVHGRYDNVIKPDVLFDLKVMGDTSGSIDELVNGCSEYIESFTEDNDMLIKSEETYDLVNELKYRSMFSTGKLHVGLYTNYMTKGKWEDIQFAMESVNNGYSFIIDEQNLTKSLILVKDIADGKFNDIITDRVYVKQFIQLRSSLLTSSNYYTVVEYKAIMKFLCSSLSKYISSKYDALDVFNSYSLRELLHRLKESIVN